MRKIIVLLAMLFIPFSQMLAQKDTISRIPLIGEDAPSFVAETTNGTLNFPSDFGNKWKILFSHPADFTPVCSSEILELAAMQNDFDKLGVKLAVVSTDQLDRHNSWKKTLEDISFKGREPMKIKFPFIDDNSRTISREYGMISPRVNATKAVRGVFIINPENKIELIQFYPMNLGRNMDEIKRTVIALQTAHSGQVLMPANWNPGDDVLLPYINKTQAAQLGKTGTSEIYSLTDDVWSPGFNEFQDAAQQETQSSPDVYSISWFMFYKKNE
jgi:peroxiredoxin 2/4